MTLLSHYAAEEAMHAQANVAANFQLPHGSDILDGTRLVFIR